MKITTLLAMRAIAASIALIGLWVVFGWASGNESMVRVLPDSVAMGLNTALMFIAAAICLLPSNSTNRRSMLGVVQTFCRWLLIVLPSLILVEHWHDINLGIDWTALHATVKDGNPRPGRTAPNTCLGFLLTGVVFLVYPRAQTQRFS